MNQPMESRVTRTEGDPSLEPVEPIRPVAPYIGGKRNLARRLVDRIEAVPHGIYAEPFVGMGGVFFRRRRRPPHEVINDISKDVATLFRILQRHYPLFRQTIEFQLTTRADFDRLVRTDPSTQTDLERAARFLYLQRTAFGGKVKGRNFGVSPERGARFDLTKLGPMLQDVHERMAGVTIECLPYADFIGRYDGPATLFYLDPPYWGCETDYGKLVFERQDFERLAELLLSIKGRFLLSLNDVPEVRRIFANFEIEAIGTTYSINSAGRNKPAGEVIISGGGRNGR